MQHRKMCQPAEWPGNQPTGPQRPAKIPVCKLALDGMGAPTGPAGGVPPTLFHEKIFTVRCRKYNGRGAGVVSPYLVCKSARPNKPT